jgi:RNA polymerase sigma factor (sigma-70 family)
MFETIRELTAGMAAGESRAVEVFYRRYFDVMYSHAKQVMRRDEAVCLDVVQDAVLRVVKTVRRVESEGQFRAWLRLVTQTTAFDMMKSDSRRRRRETAVAVGGGPVPEKEADAGDRLAWLKDQIAKLDPATAEMIDMRFQKRWTLARIAGSLGLSIGTVDGRLRRALGRLRDSAGSELDNE